MGSAAAVIVGTAYLLSNWMAQRSLSKIPSMDASLTTLSERKARFYREGRNLLRQGYRQFTSGAFRITTHTGPMVMLSRSLMEEVLKKPDSEIDFEAPVKHDFETKYTGMTTYEPVVPHSIRADLTPGLGRLIPKLAPEIQAALFEELPLTSAWEPCNVNTKLLRIVTIVSGSVFVGPELCRREEWIKSATAYTVDVFTGARELKKWSSMLRPLAARFGWVPELNRTQQHKRDIIDFLKPEVRRRKEMMRRAEEGEKWEKPDDMLQWTMDKAAKFDITEDEHLAFIQLGVGLVSIHSTTMTATQALYDLAAYPEYMQPLRDELSRELAKTGGQFSKEALYNCKLLDSFIKESQRLSPGVLSIGKRTVTNGFSLSNGAYLPRGTVVACPSEAVGRDASIYPDPDRFDGRRFYDLRLHRTDFDRYQLVTTGRESLHFGYGRHSCPGRFFAAVEIKIILATVLRHFDVKFADEAAGLPESLILGDACLPDPTKELLFRRV